MNEGETLFRVSDWPAAPEQAIYDVLKMVSNGCIRELLMGPEVTSRILADSICGAIHASNEALGQLLRHRLAR